MKSKIVALSKNEEFKNLLNQRKVSNKYVTIFFGKLINKENTKLNDFVNDYNAYPKKNFNKVRFRNFVNDLFESYDG